MGTGSPDSTVRDTRLLSFPSKSGRRQAKFPALLAQNCCSGNRPNADIGQYQVQRSPQEQSVPPTQSLPPPPILSWSFQIVLFISSYSAALRRDSPEATGWLPGGSPSYCLCSFCLGADVFPGVRLWEARPLDRLGFLVLGLGTDFLTVL